MEKLLLKEWTENDSGGDVGRITTLTSAFPGICVLLRAGSCIMTKDITNQTNIEEAIIYTFEDNSASNYNIPYSCMCWIWACWIWACVGYERTNRLEDFKWEKCIFIIFRKIQALKPDDFRLRHSCAHWYLQPVAANPDFSSHVFLIS